ncbi:hypothetical protein ACHHYP_08839 [Achlya hypogyna]|uniref:Potassium channel tetramerisation-type BTB domain-containing protein n=1 Tax=Achlya hypogyna TaxID=1202772 RepID=A0A1V9YP14_ACHHY|nr:hypothetical protein ACHHYP_08839 [Achlya hypogyna]
MDHDVRTHPRVLHEASETELYQTVVEARQEKLRAQLQKVAGQKAFLRHEKRRLLLQRALLESEVDRFHASTTSDWFCNDVLSTSGLRLRLRVGGQDFELSHALAKRDPKSLLAALVASDAPLPPGEVGCYALDRDWNLFRHILNFLRDGLLPNDPKLLKLLYIESDFWKLASLKQAVEQSKIQLPRAPVVVEPPNAAKSVAEAKPGAKPTSTKPWWSEPPLWWGKPMVKATEPKKEDKPDMYSWWKGTKYKGNDYAKFLCDDLFVPAKPSAPGPSKQPPGKKEDPQYPALRSTWTSYRHLS